MDAINTRSGSKANDSRGYPAGVGATWRIASHLAELSYAALPAALVDLTKQCILDTVGVTIGASSLAPEGRLVADYVRAMEGKPESTILGFGGRAPAPWAAFVNGGLGHMLDYDDVAPGGHPSITTVLCGLAAAEKYGPVSGKDLITAIAGGMDLQTRIAHSITLDDWTITEGWFATQLLGYLAGAATVGRLLGLDAEQMENALGIGFNQMSGSRQMAVGEATHMRSMQAGFSGQGGLMAAELAQRGVVGSKEILEGRYGVFRTYVRGEPEWTALLDGLGSAFPLVGTHGFKVWPACGYTRATNAAVQHLRQGRALDPAGVEAITVIGGSGGTQLLSEPIDLKRRPKLSIDGKYSIPFTTAVMMVKGTVTLADYTEAGLNDPTVLAMADRVSWRARAADDTRGRGDGLPLPTVAVQMKDGTVHEHTPDGVPGDPSYPVGWDALESKFRDCVSFSVTPVAEDKVTQAVALVRNLEHATDAAELVRLLS
jgi:2-methylcitrate dehydratase PrpD